LLRGEAVLVLREICECIPNESAVSYVFLEPTKKRDGVYSQEYSLQIKMYLDKATRKGIESVARKHGLLLVESDGRLILSALEEALQVC
jgi:hypothetical protein